MNEIEEELLKREKNPIERICLEIEIKQALMELEALDGSLQSEKEGNSQ